jgi:hypothetical protein
MILPVFTLSDVLNSLIYFVAVYPIEIWARPEISKSVLSAIEYSPKWTTPVIRATAIFMKKVLPWLKAMATKYQKTLCFILS